MMLTSNAFGGALLDLYDAGEAAKIRLDVGGGVSTQSGLFFRCYNPANTKYGELKSDSEGVILIAQSSGDVLKLATIDQSVQVWNGGNLRWWVTNPGTMLNPGTYGNTTASAANVYVHTDGSFNRSTSSLRFKEVLEPVADDWAYKLLDLEGIFYKSKCSGDNQDWTYYGFGAEAVAQIDPRWVFWKTHEYAAITAKGEEPELVRLPEPVADGVQYERMVVALQHIAKREKARADAAEARLNAIEVRLAALEAA
jgi:hypothetical protein